MEEILVKYGSRCIGTTPLSIVNAWFSWTSASATISAKSTKMCWRRDARRRQIDRE